MTRTKKFLLASVVASTLAAASPALAHCDSADGPVAGAALQALETGNVNLALPYAPASAEPEITAAFDMALEARDDGDAARQIADRWFAETVVRLHRAGEGAPYTGLKPAGQDFGPVIPAAEEALETGDVAPLASLLAEATKQSLGERLEMARAVAEHGSAEPASAEDVPSARERVSAEFAFIGYAEGIHQALQSGGHSEGQAEPQAEH